MTLHNRSAIQSVADEIKESRRLKIVSSSLDLEGGPFGPDPRRAPGWLGATSEVCFRVCVCERERDREGEKEIERDRET